MPSKPTGFARLASAFTLMLLCAVMVGTVVAVGMLLLRWTGKRLGIHWLANADRDMLKLLSILCFLFPCMLVLSRVKTRRALKAKARKRRRKAQLRADEESQLRWSIPASVELSELPTCMVVVAGLYIVTLLSVTVILGTFNLIATVRHQPITEPTLATAVRCANFMGLMMLSLLAFLLLLLSLGVRNRILLTPEELVERGNPRKAYPYRSMIQCQIEPSQKVRTLRCIAFSTANGNAIKWHRFELSPSVRIEEVIAFLNSKGLKVAIIDSRLLPGRMR